MDYPSPMPNIITIYSKSGCTYCKKSKNYLTNINKPFQMIDCDEFLLDNKADFLLFIKKLSNVDINTFPIIFNGTEFIGGYNELIIAVNNESSNNNNDNNNNNNENTDSLFESTF